MDYARLPHPVTILVAEDDPEDRLLARKALSESRRVDDVRFVEDGVELLAYLRQEGAYEAPGLAPVPGIILLDLNMPCVDGWEALAAIKQDARLRHIPIVVLTTSRADEDVLRSYGLGANSFITKPASFGDLIHVMNGFLHYWLDIARLPHVN